MATNRAHLATVSARIDTLEAQLSRGTTRITEESVDRFGDLLKTKLRGDDQAMRSSYIRMFVSDVRVALNDVIVSGPMAALEAGVAIGKPVVPSFDREWCPEEDSNLHDLAIAST